MSANQETYLHHADRQWWHLFWLIPLFPTGTNYQTILRGQDTINDPEFYNRFFSALTKQLAAADTGDTPGSGPAH